MRRTIALLAAALVLVAVTAAEPASATAADPASGSATAQVLGSNVVVNGGFETGTFSGWTTSGASTAIVGTAHSGSYAAQLGSTGPTKGNSTMTQTVTVPAAATLSFWYLPSCVGSTPTNREQVQVQNTAGTRLLSVLNVCSDSNTWTPVTKSLGALAGQTVVLWFNNHDDDGASTPSATIFDDVSIAGATPAAGLVQLSADPYTNTTSEHATEVEPDTLSQGSVVVSAFQAGRFRNGGSDDLGWATSTDDGQTWHQGFLPGITVSQGGGHWARVSDPSVAYDAKAGTWLVSGLVVDGSGIGRGVSVSRSPDGMAWANPTMAVTSATSYLDKDWIACDSTPTSPEYGNCYIEFDNNTTGNTIYLLTSTDGGATWSAPRQPADGPSGLGGQPLVQPGGTVVVPYLADAAGQIRSFVSTDGGTSWGASVLVSNATTHTVAGHLRTTPLPSAEIDGAGTVYVAWQDCRFRSGCAANDIVLSTSANGTTWTAVRRVPIDAETSNVDHFIPGVAVDRSTSATAAHLGLAYYFFPDASCSSATCQLDVGFIWSTDGGATWSAPTTLAGPTSISQIASTTQGAMVGDYISTSFVAGRAVPVFAVGQTPAGASYNEAMYSVPGGLAPAAGGSAPSTVWPLAVVVGPQATPRLPVTAS